MPIIKIMVLLHKAFVFKLKPDGATIRKLARFCGCARYVYNKGLAWDKEMHEKDPSFKLSYSKLCALLPEWKKETTWLAECYSQVLQQAMKDLHGAFQSFWEGRTNFPKFHKKFKDEDSIRFPQGFQIDQARKQIRLPGIGWCNYRRSRFIEGTIRSITVMRKADGWYVSVLTQREVEPPVHPKKGVEVGLDVGVAVTAMLSDDTPPYKPANALRQNLAKLAKLQRALKRMTKFGKNWKKQQAKIARLHKRIADIRRDHLRKIARDICKNHAVVYREDLRIKNMVKSASGTVEEPGKNVEQKSGLNLSIHDQGWGMLFRMLDEYMLEMGGEVRVVPPQYTSRTCPACGHVAAENRPTQSKFLCVKCGYKNNADRVGAINILRVGQTRSACGSVEAASTQVNRTARKRRSGQQQEPIEETVGKA